MGNRGVCSLCLEIGDLTFEHIPPRRAFNSAPSIAHTLYGLQRGSELKKFPLLLKGPRGVGRHSLCARCNNKTGAFYGDAFADWTTQCLRYSERVRGSNDVLLPFSIQPLNVLKQIATMMIAASESTVSSIAYDTIRRFVLCPQAMALPPTFVFAGYLNPTDPARSKNQLLTQNRLSGSCAVLDIRVGASVFVIGEVAFPPMGYVLYLNERGARISDDFKSLCDLRLFASSHYGQRRDIFLRMPVRYPFGPTPGYYPDLSRPAERVPLDDNHVVITAKNARPATGDK